MAVIYKVSATAGKYTNNEGEEKNRYVDMGVVMETKNGPMLKLEAIPVNWDGWAYLNEPKPREEGQRQDRGRPQRQQPESAPADDFQDDDLPF